MTSRASDYWDEQAASFDREPDHGLDDPSVREAWRSLLLSILPAPPARVLDLGCGTGSLTLLLAREGYDVCGLELSGAMLAAARNKLIGAGLRAVLVRGDATRLPFAPESFDVVLERHVLWALGDTGEAVARWSALLRRDGVLLMIEGRWSTGAGIAAVDAESLVRGCGRRSEVVHLRDAQLWGREISDVRYALVSRP